MRLIRGGEMEGGGVGGGGGGKKLGSMEVGGEREIIYLSRYTVTTRMTPALR